MKGVRHILMYIQNSNAIIIIIFNIYKIIYIKLDVEIKNIKIYHT